MTAPALNIPIGVPPCPSAKPTAATAETNPPSAGAHSSPRSNTTSASTTPAKKTGPASPSRTSQPGTNKTPAASNTVPSASSTRQTSSKPSDSSATGADGHHGSARGYRLGCRENCCRIPGLRYKKRHRRFGKLSVDPAPAAAHIRTLLAHNATQQSIADAAGTSTSQIWAILSGRRTTIRQATRDKILAVTVVEPGGLTDATGSTRRLRALLADGHAVADITAASGIDDTTITRIVAGANRNILRHTATAITQAYQVLSVSPGTNARNRLRGGRENWARPAHWDGIDMDDPEAFPDWTGACGTPRGRHQHQGRRILPVCPPCRSARLADDREKAA